MTDTVDATATVTGPGPGRSWFERRPVPGGRAAVLAVCLAAAWASLALPALLGFDPWVWLIWGREALDGRLTTDGSVAWKPLPVLATAPLALTGDAAPALWTVLVRAAGLFGLALLARLCVRLARRWPGVGAGAAGVGAAVAVAGVVLGPDVEARWLRHMLQANVEPLLVALLLLAVERHLDGRRGHALLALCAASLARPEAWPLLGVCAVVYACRLWGRPCRQWSWRAVLTAVALAVVPVAWFAGDRMVSGNPMAGAAVARVLLGTPAERWTLAWANAGATVLAPVWIAAAVGLALAVLRRQWAPVAVAAAAVLWAAEVVVMAGAYGYAALGRFYAPLAAGTCLLAGLGVAWVVAAARPVAARAVVAVAVVAAMVPFAPPRVGWLPIQLAAASERSTYERDLYAVAAAAGGRDALLACGPLAIDVARPAIELRSALAYRLGLPLGGVTHVLYGSPGTVAVQIGSPLDRLTRTRPPTEIRPVTASALWSVHTELCPRVPR